MGETVAINEVFRRRQGAERKNGTRGRDRYTIEVESEPLLHQFDDLAVGQGVADAMADAIRAGIKAIRVPAAAATLEYRRRAAAAFERGAKWATKRYAGGRTGATPPRSAGQVTLFNDSGRFADTVVARSNRYENAFTVNVAANRLDPRDFDDISFRRMLSRLRELVPALDARKLGQAPAVKQALRDSVDDLITKARNEREAKLIELRQAKVRALIAVGRAVAGVA